MVHNQEEVEPGFEQCLSDFIVYSLSTTLPLTEATKLQMTLSSIWGWGDHCQGEGKKEKWLEAK